jgi:tRNA-specific 2-thiouridylase
VKRVVVGLSGGVDSSVAAYLLKEQGYDVIGIFMRNWHDESVTINNECPWIDDSNDAQLVAEKLGIPFQTIDYSEVYRKRIVDYMFREYEQGRTPNPDVLCNREIKFDVFLDTALKLGADYVATGHYCQKDEIQAGGRTIHRLLAGADPNKDQSYFLCQLTQEQLSKALFPIGHLQKSEVRKIAKDLNLVTADKKDSQGLCFIGKVKLPDFLQQQLSAKKGNILELEADSDVFSRSSELTLAERAKAYDFESANSKLVGEHDGAHFFTVGQRKGLAVGGTVEPLFVLGTDTEKNVIYTGQGNEHPGLWRKVLKIKKSDIHWLRTDMKLSAGEEKSYDVRIRYRQPLQSAKLIMTSDGLFIEFESPQSAITPGQFAAWYEGNELIGSGVISE